MASWTEKLNQMTQSAISKSKEVAGVTKLNLEISSLNQNIKNIQTEIGAYVLENELLKEDSTVVEWAAKVAGYKAEIEAANEKICELKNVNICPSCGAEVSRTSKFCDKCGTAIVTKSAEPEKEDEVVVDASFSAAEEEKAEETVECACGAQEEAAAEECACGAEQETKEEL